MSSLRSRSRSARSALSDGRLAVMTPNPTRRLDGAATHPARALRSPSNVHPFAAGVKRHLNVYLTLRTSRVYRVKWIVAIAIACLLWVAACSSGSLDVSVAHWQVGSPDVSGSVDNGTSQGCTDPEISLKFFDHNGARIQEFTFGAGELAAGAKRNWSTHMVGLFDIDKPVAANVTSANATVVCADQH